MRGGHTGTECAAEAGSGGTHRRALRKRRLAARTETEAQRRKAFAAATAMMEKWAEHVPDGAYKDMYDALKAIHDTLNHTEDPTSP